MSGLFCMSWGGKESFQSISCYKTDVLRATEMDALCMCLGHAELAEASLFYFRGGFTFTSGFIFSSIIPFSSSILIDTLLIDIKSPQNKYIIYLNY